MPFSAGIILGGANIRNYMVGTQEKGQEKREGGKKGEEKEVEGMEVEEYCLTFSSQEWVWYVLVHVSQHWSGDSQSVVR